MCIEERFQIYIYYINKTWKWRYLRKLNFKTQQRNLFIPVTLFCTQFCLTVVAPTFPWIFSYLLTFTYILPFWFLQTTLWSQVALCHHSAHSRGTVATNWSMCDQTQRLGFLLGIGLSQSPSGQTRILLLWWAEELLKIWLCGLPTNEFDF